MRSSPGAIRQRVMRVAAEITIVRCTPPTTGGDGMTNSNRTKPDRIGRKAYEEELARLEIELVKLQGFIKAKGLKVVVLFEGRDSAGKGGTIKRITYRLNPRVARVVALGTPTEREKTQWYYQRYLPHLPAAGEMVLFDRSWYNRAGVERVMEFCNDDEYWSFLQTTPGFENALIDSGIILIKYWLDITAETQERRFRQRIKDPRKRWKLSPMDLQSRARWVDYSRARDVMFAYTSTDASPWNVVDANIKRHARLNVIRHLLSSIPYEDYTPDAIELPPRQSDSSYVDPPEKHFRWIHDAYA